MFIDVVSIVTLSGFGSVSPLCVVTDNEFNTDLFIAPSTLSISVSAVVTLLVKFDKSFSKVPISGVFVCIFVSAVETLLVNAVKSLWLALLVSVG